MTPGLVSTVGEIVFGRYKLDPRSLNLEENDFLAETSLGGVEVKCCYKPCSQWGVLTGLCGKHDKCPAWRLVMDLEIQQGFGKLDYAALSVGFKASAPGKQPRHGIVVTDDYGPRRDNSHTWQFNASTSATQEEGDTLRRRITWMVKEARGTKESQLSLSWELWVTVRHDGDHLFVISPDVSGRLQGLDRIWGFWPKVPIQPRTVQPQVNEGMELSPHSPTVLLKTFQKNASDQTVSLTTGLEMAIEHSGLSGSLFDSESVLQPPKSNFSAEIWLDKLSTTVGSRIRERRRQGDTAVKVAVLDTGINREHPAIEKNRRKNCSSIRDYRDWTDSPHGIEDRVGHGTAVCDILLQVAKVDLYVGKVSERSHFDDQTAARVAEAINHAASRTGWDVDIIVLSFGFDRQVDPIRLAIQDAFNLNKIVLAAASNSGSLSLEKRVTYPANVQGQVLSIRSATGFGSRSLASPTRSDGDDSFMILGEGIKAAWPPYLNESGCKTRYVSGSSFATPVAAGIAALVLEFSMQRGRHGPNVSPPQRAILRSYRGLRRVFLYMSTIDDQSVNIDCRMIAPWRLFNPERDYEGHKYEIEMLMNSTS
ncbi:uncharacterized protein N7496_009077 [Penicillium cataractarum]|uniref:Peptidase S8/S53 domain-containing protein n=1 Tax=Penicillium cataractarum TaxID=2100454 RepID=A0A9W9S081_9EURO|nr:uncharacterized protein N7496_009077 [Penicillium cataractarum]KAJ5369317.1 hypothetical protein N7496_009077 [Penicillium cataractarum]